MSEIGVLTFFYYGDTIAFERNAVEIVLDHKNGIVKQLFCVNLIIYFNRNETEGKTINFYEFCCE